MPKPISLRPSRPTTTLHLSRRTFLALPPALTLLGLSATDSRADTPLLKESDAEAQSMDYREDASKIKVGQFPKFKPGQTCANCSLYAGDKGAASGPCGLFLNKDVAAIGWCNAWEAKT